MTIYQQKGVCSSLWTQYYCQLRDYNRNNALKVWNYLYLINDVFITVMQLSPVKINWLFVLNVYNLLNKKY